MVEAITTITILIDEELEDLDNDEDDEASVQELLGIVGHGETIVSIDEQ